MRNEIESALWRLLYPESQEAFQKVRRTHYMLRTGRLGKQWSALAGERGRGSRYGDQGGTVLRPNLRYLREFTKLSIPFYVPEIFHNFF